MRDRTDPPDPARCRTCWRPTRPDDGRCPVCPEGEVAGESGPPTAEELAKWQEMKERLKRELGLGPDRTTAGHTDAGIRRLWLR